MSTTRTRERGFPATAAEVRAILDGRKTQTRRVVKPQPPEPSIVRFAGDQIAFRRTLGAPWEGGAICPYGVPGDRLWVRESAYIAPPNFCDPADATHRDAEGRPRVVGYAADMGGEAVRCAEDYGVRKRPSIHMPRWASRITLEIESVRVERAGAAGRWEWVITARRVEPAESSR